VVIRHHRLLEQYLAETLGLPLDALHAEADRLEHALSEELEARIEERLGYPTHDPHGHPIPNADLELAAVESMALSELARGERVTVLRVPDDDPELLRYLSDLSLVPGRRVELRDLAPFDGPVSVGTEAGDHSISRELAARIEVAQP
jgi:DtxR family Mn-dependent transcriptional regulator